MQVFSQLLHVPSLVSKVFVRLIELVCQDSELFALRHLSLVGVLCLLPKEVNFLLEPPDNVFFVEKLALEDLNRVFFVHLSRQTIRRGALQPGSRLRQVAAT